MSYVYYKTLTLTHQHATHPQDNADEPKVHVITFYNNGIFTVDDGPPRRVEDPANFPFIQSIAKVRLSRGMCTTCKAAAPCPDWMALACPDTRAP